MRVLYYHPKDVVNNNYGGKKPAHTRCTVAGVYNPETKTLSLSFVALSNKDKIFSKAVGRRNAMGRVNKLIAKGPNAVKFPFRIARLQPDEQLTNQTWLTLADDLLFEHGYEVMAENEIKFEDLQ